MTPPKELHQDAGLEQWLTDKGRTFEYLPDLDLAAVRLDPNQQVRSGGLFPAVVATCANALRKGDVFPAIVVIEDQATPGAFNVIEGRHRVMAYRQTRRTEIPAYVLMGILTDSEVRYLGTAMNRRIGNPGTDIDTMEVALSLIEEGQTQTDVARELYLNQRELKTFVATRRVQRRLEALDIPVASLKPSVLTRLATIHSDPIMAEAARLCLTAHASTAAIVDLVAEINAQRSEAAQRAILAEKAHLWSAARLKAGRVRSPRGPDSAFLQYGKSLLSLELSSVQGSCLTVQRASELRELAEELRTFCEKLLAQ